MSSISYDEWKKKLGNASLPALVLDLAALDRNVKKLLKKVEDSGSKATIRLATKSIRNPELMKRAISVSPRFQGWLTYRAKETEKLAELGFDDFLLAYPEVEEQELMRLVGLHRSGKKVAMVIDSTKVLEKLSALLSKYGTSEPFPLVVEVDVSLKLLGGILSFGAKRSPLSNAKAAVSFATSIAKYPALKFHGFMAYESQVAGLQDAGPFKTFLNPIKKWIRELSIPKVLSVRTELLKFSKERGLHVHVFNGGGSGSLESTLRDPSITEVSAGSALYCSHLFSSFSNQQGANAFEPALFLALRCVRKPAPKVATCFGGGLVASGEPGWDKLPVPWLPKGARLDPHEGVGEVQTPIHLAYANDVEIGDPVIFRPAKAGESLSHGLEWIEI